MKLKKLTAILMVAAMSVGMVACGNSNNNNNNNSGTDDKKQSGNTDAAKEAIGDLNYADIKLGEDYTDITTTIKFLTHRTDLDVTDGSVKHPYSEYIEAFNELYPNITVEIESDTNYADDALLRLQGGDWGDVMMIPAVDAADLSTYFQPYGDLDTMKEEIRFATQWEYAGLVYGVPSTGNAQGIVYNKKVFEEAGVTSIPKTPEEFMTALKAIKDNTSAIPLYTNYAAGWTMGAWDAYIGGSATGKSTFMNQELVHSKAPFADPGDGTGAYNVYKILYDAVAEGLTEEDYSTTDWEGCKGMINNGEIGCMVLGSWAVPQMQEAGENGADIGYMPFPITIDGKQYASSGPDYCYGINVDSSDENKAAAMCFVKFMTEKSGFSFNEGGIPIAMDDNNYPDTYAVFDGIDYVSDDKALEGEADFGNVLNSESELNINSGGDQKIMEIVEHAANNDMTFDEIMESWNQAWSDAQDANGIEAE